jgi:hypothetical protein
MEEPLFVFIKIPESLGPIDRGDKYEEPLEQSLESAGLGEVTGGGEMLSAPDAEGHREIEYCGIDVDLFDPHRGLELLKSELKRLGAPTGTVLEYTLDDISHEVDIYEPDVYEIEH